MGKLSAQARLVITSVQHCKATKVELYSQRNVGTMDRMALPFVVQEWVLWASGYEAKPTSLHVVPAASSLLRFSLFPCPPPFD